MRASLVSLVVLATIWGVSQARPIKFNTTWTSECAAATGCNFLSDTIWEEGLIPADGDEISVIAESNINLFLSSSNLTNIALTTYATTLHVAASNINFTTVSLGGASSLVLTSSPVLVKEWLYANSSTITVEQQSELDLFLGSTTLYLDAASHILVTDTSILSSSAQSWLWGNVTSTESALLVFYNEVAIAGPTSFGSTERPHLERVTFAANLTVFPVGFTAEYVTVSSLSSVTVSGNVTVESLTTLNADSAFIVSSVLDAQFLSTTSAGSITGEGVLHLSSSTTVIAPSGAHVDGNVTNFNGTLVFSGQNNLVLALFIINSDFYTMNDSDINLHVFGVHVAAPLQFTGSITAGRFSDSIPALTVLAPVHITGCLTSVDGSLDIQSSFTCGANFPFSVSSALTDSFRPFVNFTGNLDTLGVGTLQASSALFNNTVFLASEDYEIEGIDAVLDITFVDSEVSLAGTSLLYASHINFAGTNNVVLSESSSVDYTSAAVVGGTTTITQNGYSTISGSDAAATFTLEPTSSLHLNDDSIFNSVGYSEFHGLFAQNGASSVQVNNVAFHGPTVFNSTGALDFNGNVDLSGGSLAFPNGINFASSLRLANGTSLEVWVRLSVAAPVYIAAGAKLTLRNCNARILANDTHPALWGEGELFVITSFLDTDVPPNTVNFYYADYEGPVTIGGVSTLSLLLFSFNQITFTTGAADEPADVLLEAYGVRFNAATEWPGPAVLHPAVGTYPALEVHAPVSFTSITSYSASLNLTNELTSLYGPILFQHPDDFASMFWTSNNSMIVAPQGLILQGTQFVAGPGTTSVHANVENLAGSIISVSSATNLQIYGNYNGSESNILYTSLNKAEDAPAPINVTDVADLAGTSAWYGVVIEKSNDTLKESINNVAIFEAQKIEAPFAHVVAGLPTTENVTITSSISTHEGGRERVYINNDYTAPPSGDTPIYKKWWFWFLLIVGICLILAGVAYYVRNRKRHMYTPLEM